MTAIASQTIHSPPQSASPRPIGGRPESLTPTDRPDWGEVLGETATMAGVPAFFGPPIRIVLVPWLLLVLMLIGPFALIVTGVLVVMVAVTLVALVVAAIASPYLLIRRLHAHRMLHPNVPAALQLLADHPAGSRQLGSLPTKGMS